ncbi:MAG: dihydrofolate reductase family protein [Rhodobacteraceae bacterium]|nr:dihydrofolate reductase family protein [Paracoccaceae bacterium]
MVSGRIFLAMSLDGFVAREDHTLDWLDKQQVEGEDHGYEALMASVDGLIMGANTFRKVMSFGRWPYGKPVVVMSRSLSAADAPQGLRDKISFTPVSPPEAMAELGRKGWRSAYVDGGRLCQAFLTERLIEEMTVTIIPIILGRGRRFLPETAGDIDLKLISSTSFPSGLAQCRYLVLNSSGASA